MDKRRVFAVIVVCGLATALCFFYFSSYLLPVRDYLKQAKGIFQSPQPADPNSPSHLQLDLPHLSHSPTPAPPSPPPPDPNTQPPLSPNSSLNKFTSLPSLIPFNAPTRIPVSHLPYVTPVLDGISSTPDVLKDVPVETTAEDGTKLKIILFWNEFFSNKHFGLGYGRTPFLVAGCRVNTCLATGDRTRYPMSQVDAVLWHFRSNDKSLPKERSPHTRYIFFMMESPCHLFGNLTTYQGVFNWTFTYRRDSDIYNPYGRVYHRLHPLPLPPSPRDYAKGKTKMAAWFVSNCNTLSGREKLVGKLWKWVPVDIYGKCGSLKCDSRKSRECQEMLSRDYKFYLSFENSLCKDYVTEKFYNALNADVIPVVWGKGPYAEIAPPHSFIDAFSFPSVRALADYLLYLDKNNTAYNEYFSWKPYYQQTSDWARKAVAFCDLCEKLHSDEPPKTYDLKKWFADDSHCQTYRDSAIHDYIHNVT